MTDVRLERLVVMRSWQHGAGKFGASAAIGQVLPPKAQMQAKQDWRYVSGGGQVCLRGNIDC